MIYLLGLSANYLLTFVEFFIFIFVWLIFLLGIFVVTRVLLHSTFPTSVCNLLALSLSSSCLFHLVKMYRESTVRRHVVIQSGPPIDCVGIPWLTSLFSKYSCEDYYESLYSNGIFWQLNVLVVTTSLLSDIGKGTASMAGRMFGAFLASYMDELHWSYRLPAFFLVIVCLLSAIFALFGYRFNVGYGFFQADFSHFGKGRQIESGNGETRRFIRCERAEQNPMQLIRESYQKKFQDTCKEEEGGIKKNIVRPK